MPLLKLEAFLVEGEERKPFYLEISEPTKESEEDDYYCLIHAPSFFAKDKKIYGVDEKKAKELTNEFLGTLMEGKKLVDNEGNPAEIRL